MKAESRNPNTRPAEAGTPNAASVEAVLDSRQVAARLLMHPDTVRELAASGELPAHRVGRRFKFFWSEVRAWVAEGEERRGKREGRSGNIQHPTSNIEQPMTGPAKAGTTNGGTARGRGAREGGR